MEIKNVRDSNGNRIRGGSETCEQILRGLRGVLAELMFDGNVSVEGTAACSFNILNVRLSNEYVRRCGRNINDRGRHGSFLNWDNWVDLNNAVNDLFDEMHLKASITSNGRLFIVRNVEHGRMTEREWRSAARGSSSIWEAEFPSRCIRYSERKRESKMEEKREAAAKDPTSEI